MINNFHTPEANKFTENDIWLWYNNIKKELNEINFTKDEKKYLENYYIDAGLLSSKKKQFFRKHYSKTFYESASFLLNKNSENIILDLGAGAGTQSILFAILNAKVFAIDLDNVALSILEKRKAFYENLLGRKLNINIINANIFNLEFPNKIKINGVYSMFAFNLMQPSIDLIEKLTTSLSSNAGFCIIDGNNTFFLTYVIRSLRRDVLSPEQLREILIDKGFTIEKHIGGVSLPPFFWGNKCLSIFSNFIDKFLINFWLTSRSHHIMAKFR